MQPAHRVAAFFCLCVVFGFLVWQLDIDVSFNPTLLVAQASQPKTGNEQCVGGQQVVLTINKDGSMKRDVMNILPKYVCRDIVKVEGKADCVATYCCNPNSPSVCRCDTPGTNCAKASWTTLPATPTPAKKPAAQKNRVERLALVSQASGVFAQMSQPNYQAGCLSGNCQNNIALPPNTQGPPLPAEPNTKPDTPLTTALPQQPNLQQLPATQQQPATVSQNQAPVSAPVTTQQAAQTTQRIDAIAGNAQSQTTAGNSASQTFSPSQQLNNQSYLNPLFSGGNTGGTVSFGGSVAHAPVQQPVLYNRNFDSLGGPPSTFAQRNLSPADLIKALAANTPKERPVVTASDLKGDVVSGGIGGMLTSLGADLFSPVAEFVNNIFSPNETENEFEPLNDTKKGGMASLFEKEKLKFEGMDVYLAAGDPQEVFETLEEIAKHSNERSKNPFFNGALVRTKPWDNSDGALSGYFALDSGADVSGGEDQQAIGGEDNGDAIQKSFDGAKAPNVFSAMKLTVGTITQAITELFKNIAATLFWWL